LKTDKIPTILQVSKVTGTLTAVLGKEVLDELRAAIGDRVMFYLGDDGRIYVEKVRPNG